MFLDLFEVRRCMVKDLHLNYLFLFQRFEPQESYLPEDKHLRPLWERNIPLGTAKGAYRIEFNILHSTYPFPYFDYIHRSSLEEHLVGMCRL